MTKEDKQWLKENEPWNYDALYGDPVTGKSDNDGVINFIIVAILAGVITWGIISLF